MMRALFTMFAEDVGLLPEHAFEQQLEELRDTPDIFVDMLETLWQNMNSGGFSAILRTKVLQFNGGLFADLRIGANVSLAENLSANSNISQRGFELGNSGFLVDEKSYSTYLKNASDNAPKTIQNYRNSRDLTEKPRNVKVIDVHGYSESELQAQLPQIYQWLLERIKPERLQNRDPRLQKFWWLHRHSREDLRKMLSSVPRYIATVETMKHRLFVFLDSNILPDNKLVNIALPTAESLGVLCSRLHITWTLAAGSTLEDRPVYVKTTCFETFPFPDTSEEQQAQIRDLAERLDAHRKRQQQLHPDLTLTNMYNVLELVGLPGATTPLPDKSEAQAQAEEELLQRLVDLNTERAAEEAQGKIRWLRPEYQDPNYQQGQEFVQQGELETTLAPKPTKKVATKAAAKTTWPKTMREQIAAVRNLLQTAPQNCEQIAGQFKRNPETAVQAVLDALEELGIVQQQGSYYGLRA